MNNTSSDSANNKEAEISIADIISLIWSQKTTLLYFITACSVSSLILAFFTTNLYTSSSLVHVSQSTENLNINSITSRYIDLANVSGLGFSSGSDSAKKDLAIATLISRDFFINISKNYPDIKAKLIAAYKYDKNNKKVVFNPSLYDEGKWVKQNSEPSNIKAHKYFIENVLNVSFSKETKHIKLSITHLSPVFAKELLEICIKELNKQLKKYDLEDSSKAIKYLEDSLEKSQTNEIRNSINSLLEKQLEIQMLANIQDDYVLKIIDSPFEPLSKSYPSRLLFLFLGILIGTGTGIIYIFIRDYIQND